MMEAACRVQSRAQAAREGAADPRCSRTACLSIFDLADPEGDGGTEFTGGTETQRRAKRDCTAWQRSAVVAPVAPACGRRMDPCRAKRGHRRFVRPPCLRPSCGNRFLRLLRSLTGRDTTD